MPTYPKPPKYPSKAKTVISLKIPEKTATSKKYPRPPKYPSKVETEVYPRAETEMRRSPTKRKVPTKAPEYPSEARFGRLWVPTPQEKEMPRSPTKRKGEAVTGEYPWPSEARFSYTGAYPYQPMAVPVPEPTTTGLTEGAGAGAIKPPKPKVGVGGGGAGGLQEGEPTPEEAPTGITWQDYTFRPETAPPWWKAMKPSELTPETEYLATLNMMIPSLSWEDRRNAANQLYITDPKNFAHLSPEIIDQREPPGSLGIPGSLTREREAWYEGQRRSVDAVAALNSLRDVLGKKEEDMGPGYAFLKTIAATTGRYGVPLGFLEGGTPTFGPGESTYRPYWPGYGKTPELMSRTQAQQLMGALDPLLAMSSGETLSPYGPLAKMFAMPFFSQGNLWDYTKTDQGYMFGRPNPRLFG